MKKILIGVAVVLVIVAGAVIYLGSNLDGIVKAGVEKYAPRYTGTDVRLGSVESSLFGGEVTVNDFFLGNPEGYQTPHAFKVNSVKVAVDTETVMSDVIHIREIIIDGPDIIYELKGTASNLQAIQKNVSRAAGAGGKQESTETTTPTEQRAGKKVVIDNLYVRNTQAALSSDMLGGKVVPLPVPDIHLTDIGKKSNGATMAEASKQVMDSITNAVANAAQKIDLKGMAEDAQKMMDDAGKDAQEQMKGMEEQLKGLFGK